MSAETKTSNKTAAETIACIKQADELLQEAVRENEDLTSKLSAVTQGEDEFVGQIKGFVEKLASINSRKTGKPVLTGSQKEAWLEYMDTPQSTKTAASHMISELIDRFVAVEGDEVSKTAADAGEVADMPGQTTAPEKREPIHPTARY